MHYRLLIDLEGVAILESLPKRIRSRLFDQFHKLRDFPSHYSDCAEYDNVGRRVEICIVAGWAIHYWIDEADRHVKVLALTPADR